MKVELKLSKNRRKLNEGQLIGLKLRLDERRVDKRVEYIVNLDEDRNDLLIIRSPSTSYEVNIEKGCLVLDNLSDPNKIYQYLTSRGYVIISSKISQIIPTSTGETA
ncbi:MAG: hypothetical protein AABW91_01030 [Nanoarchaeota archaeon]